MSPIKSIPADAENLDLPREKLPEKTELMRDARMKNIPRIKLIIARVFFGQEMKKVNIETSQLITSTKNCLERKSCSTIRARTMWKGIVYPPV